MTTAMLFQEPTREPTREQIREQIRETVRDAQIAAQQAAAEARAAQGAPTMPGPPGAPGTLVPPPWENIIPPQAVSISIAFFITMAAIIIGLPIMRAIARRIERGAPVAAPIPVEMRDQLQQISQSVDAIAIEVERISEAQRFTSKMLADRVREPAAIASESSQQR